MERISEVNKPPRAPWDPPAKVGENNGHNAAGDAEALRRPS
jgi:hypothetical protein